MVSSDEDEPPPFSEVEDLIEDYEPDYCNSATYAVETADDTGATVYDTSALSPEMPDAFDEGAIKMFQTDWTRVTYFDLEEL